MEGLVLPWLGKPRPPQLPLLGGTFASDHDFGLRLVQEKGKEEEFTMCAGSREPTHLPFQLLECVPSIIQKRNHMTVHFEWVISLNYKNYCLHGMPPELV